MKTKAFFTICLLLFGTIALHAQELIRFQGNNGKYGFKVVNTVVIKPIYEDAATSFSEKRGAVKLKGKWGYIDEWNKEVIPFQYDKAYKFQQGIAKVVLNDETFYIDINGKRIDPNAPKEVVVANKMDQAIKPIKTSEAPEPLPIDITETKGNTIIKLGDRKFTVSKNDKPEGSGYLKVTGDFDKISINALSKRTNQNQYYFEFKKNELTASRIVHIPGLGLAGLANVSNMEAKTFNARIAWFIFEDKGFVRYAGPSDYLFIHNLHPNGVTADRILYFGMYEKGKNFRLYKFDKSITNRSEFCYVSLYENGKRTHLWENVQHLLIHSDDYKQKKNNLCFRIGNNQSAIFVNDQNETLTAYVIDATLSQINSHPNVSLVATNDGSSGTAFTLHHPQNSNKDPMFGPQFGPNSYVFYSILLPTENEGYYKVLDENGFAFKPENSYGLLPFITTHKHIKRGRFAQHRLDTTQYDFEVLHFFMAVLKVGDELQWQPVNHFGKSSPTQQDLRFKHWEPVESKTLSKVNAISALPYFLLAYTTDNKWQAFFPSKYGITHLPRDVFDQYNKEVIQPLTKQLDSPDEAFVQAEVQIEIIQNAHVKNSWEAYTLQQAQIDKMWEEYRRQHSGKPSTKVDWSIFSNMLSDWRNDFDQRTQYWNGGVRSETQKLKDMRYYMGKAPTH